MARFVTVASRGGKQRRSNQQPAPLSHVLLPEIFSLAKLALLLGFSYFVLDGPLLALVEVVVGTETSVSVAGISTASLTGNAALGLGLTVTMIEKSKLRRELQVSLQA